jgi:alpha/beta superfamily hydrolase
VIVGAPPRALEAILEAPPGATAGAVVCHPHPEYGGSMHTPVVVAVARALREAGRAVLRFNFGGVGGSQGAYSGGPQEVEDVAAALAALADRLPPGAPLALAGCSFGAWAGLRAAARKPEVTGVIAVAPPLDLLDWSFMDAVSCPVVCIVGDRDQYCAPARVARLVSGAGGRVVAHTLAGADHFLAGREAEVGALAARLLAPAA